MLPVILQLGSIPIASFGLFLCLAIFVSSFCIWRLGKIYDFHEDKITDLILITFFWGLFASRVYFVAFHQNLFFIEGNPWFSALFKIILIHKFPGLSFWGGLIGGLISLSVLSQIFKVSLLQILDFALVGLFIGISISSLGCFFSGCSAGLPSNLPFAVKMFGLVGKRFPLQILESLLFFFGFLYLWKETVQFHFIGKIASVGLIILGLIKLILETFRDIGGDRVSFLSFGLGYIFSLAASLLGIWIYYLKSGRSIKKDLRLFYLVFVKPSIRKTALQNFYRFCYNQKVGFKLKIESFRKLMYKKLNIKPTPKELNG